MDGSITRKKGFPGGSESKESACSAGDWGSIPGLGRSPGEENGNPLQDSCLENPMDRGAWWATICGVSKSWTWLSDYHVHTRVPNVFLKKHGQRLFPKFFLICFEHNTSNNLAWCSRTFFVLKRKGVFPGQRERQRNSREREWGRYLATETNKQTQNIP